MSPESESFTPQPPKPPENATKIHPVVEFLWKEWRVIKNPSFYIAVGIIAIGLFWLEERHYGGTIVEKDATIVQNEATIRNVSEQRDSANRENDKLARDNEWLRNYRSKETMPLKQNALILARQIHDYIKDWKDTDSPDQKYQHVQKYLQRFGLRASIMRDDLDQSGQHSDDFDKVMYDFQMTYPEVRIIADEIEKLANKLPDAPP
ncbi:MAG: hypothetical protein ABSD57_09765 [Verrucomicrobiota bacterium]|jgi:hypothetical protein